MEAKPNVQGVVFKKRTTNAAGATRSRRVPINFSMRSLKGLNFQLDGQKSARFTTHRIPVSRIERAQNSLPLQKSPIGAGHGEERAPRELKTASNLREFNETSRAGRLGGPGTPLPYNTREKPY
jgi:hypothetical protein